MTDPIDLKAIAETALEAFPAAPDGMDPAGNYAQVMLTKEITRLGKAGVSIDADRAQAWRAELEALVAEMGKTFVPTRPVEEPPAPSVHKAPRSAPEIDLDWLVADAFSAPYDGTVERAQVLATRARGNLERALDREDFGWLRRRSLMREGERLIAKYMDELERF